MLLTIGLISMVRLTRVFGGKADDYIPLAREHDSLPTPDQPLPWASAATTT